MPNCTACNASPARSSPEYLAVGDGDFNGAFHMLQTLDLAEIEFPFTGARLGPTVDRSEPLRRFFGTEITRPRKADMLN